MLTRLGLLMMRCVAVLPLRCVRALGTVLGHLIFVVAARRRHVVRTNIRLCFPQAARAQRRALVRQSFVRFAQAWLDRSWLWHGDPQRVRQRLRITGALGELAEGQPVVVFAPHFVGLDAGWTALTQQIPRVFSSIYTRQRSPLIDRWIYQGRQRFGATALFERREGAKAIVRSLRAGEALYLLPDMNFGPQESIFVPFYGIPAATLTSLSRFARLGKSKVVPVVTRMTRFGYEVQVHAAWPEFPSADPVADTARMNRQLQAFIDGMPDQYYWVHRRFKTRPPGEPPVY